MSSDTTNLHSRVTGGYISLTVHIWVDDNGRLIRGTIEDVHARARLAVDISALASFLRESLAHASAWNAREERDVGEEALEQEPSNDRGTGEV